MARDQNFRFRLYIQSKTKPSKLSICLFVMAQFFRCMIMRHIRSHARTHNTCIHTHMYIRIDEQTQTRTRTHTHTQRARVSCMRARVGGRRVGVENVRVDRQRISRENRTSSSIDSQIASIRIVVTSFAGRFGVRRLFRVLARKDGRR